MATLDVADLLEDPDFADNFSVERRSAVANQYGENVITAEILSAVGVVQPGGSDLVRTPDMGYATNQIRVFTKFRLRGPTPGYQPDVVIWNEARYIVRRVSDFTNYGQGYIDAQCDALGHIDPPPPE